MTVSPGTSACSFSSCSYCGVRPQREATLTTSAGPSPARSRRVVCSPVRVRSGRSYCDASPPRALTGTASIACDAGTSLAGVSAGPASSRGSDTSLSRPRSGSRGYRSDSRPHQRLRIAPASSACLMRLRLLLLERNGASARARPNWLRPTARAPLPVAYKHAERVPIWVCGDPQRLDGHSAIDTNLVSESDRSLVHSSGFRHGVKNNLSQGKRHRVHERRPTADG